MRSPQAVGRRVSLSRAAWATIAPLRTLSHSKKRNSEIGMCAPQKCAARLRCCPGNGGMGGRRHLQQEFSMQTMFSIYSERLYWDDLLALPARQRANQAARWLELDKNEEK